MVTKQHPSDPLPLNLAARCLRVPARWLRDEIEAGRVPALIAGRSVLVHVPTVAAKLAERAKSEFAHDFNRVTNPKPAGEQTANPE